MKKYLLQYKVSLLLGLSLVLLTPIAIYTSSSKHTTINLTGIESRLSRIEMQMRQPAPQLDLRPIHTSLSRLSHTLEQIKDAEQPKWEDIITDNQQTLKGQLDNINASLQKLDENKHPIKVLPISELPFKVLSIDSLQDTAVSSVLYDYKFFPLELGDSLASWTVIALDFAMQKIVFEHEDKSQVIVKLKEDPIHEA